MATRGQTIKQLAIYLENVISSDFYNIVGTRDKFLIKLLQKKEPILIKNNFYKIVRIKT
jgi:hypothetical protein